MHGDSGKLVVGERETRRRVDAARAAAKSSGRLLCRGRFLNKSLSCVRIYRVVQTFCEYIVASKYLKRIFSKKKNWGIKSVTSKKKKKFNFISCIPLSLSLSFELGEKFRHPPRRARLFLHHLYIPAAAAATSVTHTYTQLKRHMRARRPASSHSSEYLRCVLQARVYEHAIAAIGQGRLWLWRIYIQQSKKNNFFLFFSFNKLY